MIYMKNMSQLQRQSWYVDSGLVVWPLTRIQINFKNLLWLKAGPVSFTYFQSTDRCVGVYWILPSIGCKGKAIP